MKKYPADMDIDVCPDCGYVFADCDCPVPAEEAPSEEPIIGPAGKAEPEETALCRSVNCGHTWLLPSPCPTCEDEATAVPEAQIPLPLRPYQLPTMLKEITISGTFTLPEEPTAELPVCDRCTRHLDKEVRHVKRGLYQTIPECIAYRRNDK